jgi:hypothetical protein
MKLLIIVVLGILLFSCNPSEKAIERKERRAQETLLQNQRENNSNYENNIEIKQYNLKVAPLKIKESPE